jgi:hypothetical protein
MAELSIDREHYAWYRDLRRQGTLAARRLRTRLRAHLAYVAGLAKVRDAIPFPRTPGNAQYSCVLLGDRVCVRRRLALDAYGAVTATRGFRFVRSATDSPNSDPSLKGRR